MQLGVHNTAIRNYWWISSLGGLYFVGGFILWGGTRASMISASIFVIVGVIGLVVHYRAASMSRETAVAMVIAHLIVGYTVLIWQKDNLPLSDYTTTGNPQVRDDLVYLVSALILGTMSMFGGKWGALVGLALHYGFVFENHGEFSFKWAFPVLIALAGNVVSSASSRLELANDKLDSLANHDQLTGLFNRHRMTEEFARVQSLALDAGRTLLLVAWDLDDLKYVNDTHGHVAGDAYITSFADALRKQLRSSSDSRAGDAAFRIGGDEFISLHADGHGGESILERVRAAFPAVSAGWVRAETLTLDQALTQADAALYVDKAQRKSGQPRSA
jgi:diguanylate cyclase (GGDEF)-like protein